VADSSAEQQQQQAAAPPIPDDVPVDEGKIMEAYKRLMAEDPRDHLNVVFIGHVDAGDGSVCADSGGKHVGDISRWVEAAAVLPEGGYMSMSCPSSC
jgi:peptide chain release factor subunit 3